MALEQLAERNDVGFSRSIVRVSGPRISPRFSDHRPNGHGWPRLWSASQQMRDPGTLIYLAAIFPDVGATLLRLSISFK